MITGIKVLKETIYLLAIYDKSEQEDLTKSEMESLMGFIDSSPSDLEAS